MAPKSHFKEKYPLERRLEMVSQRKLYAISYLRTPTQILLIVQKDQKCKYIDINSKIFLIETHQKVIEIYNTIRKKVFVQDIMKFERSALFIYTQNRILNKGRYIFSNADMTIGQLYEKEKDKEDGMLYLFYSDMEPF